MKNKKLTFKTAYLIYFSVLVALVALATLYVSNLLQKYEDTRPEKYVETAMDELKKNAEAGMFWQTYFLPEIELEMSRYEDGLDMQAEYVERLVAGKTEYVAKSGDYPEDELYYTVTCEGAPIAEVKLKAKGPAVTKLAILSYREWNVEYTKPIVEKNDYTLVVPEDFSVKANDIVLDLEDGKSNGKGETEYTVKGVYFAPEFEIKDALGETVSYEVTGNKIVAEYYYYKLNLPSTLSVKVNGLKVDGVPADECNIHYDIKELKKPEVILSDLYGNEFVYEGGKKVPLTHKIIRTEAGCVVKVMDAIVPAEAMTTQENPEYEALKEYVSDLPDLTVYNIAVLEENVKVSVTEENGNEVVLEENETEYSFMAKDAYLDEVPDEVSAEVDVLKLAQKWSLFMSADLAFNEMKQYLIKDSYQYEVAVKYATGIDIKFISGHGLASPPFTEEKVTNFVWISDNCFSVDISFVKHMILNVGSKVNDPMNDRFYFVKYDDTDDGVSNPAWKIASMKEIVNDAE